jgi:hypothetical protein
MGGRMDELTRLIWSLDGSRIMADIGLEPDDWQRQLLMAGPGRIGVCSSRQVGKSTTTACLAIGQALANDDSLILLISPTQRQSDELYRKVYYCYDMLGRPIDPVEDSAHTLALANGSRIVSLPGNPENLRGFSSPDLIIIDEAARVSDAMESACSPMLATVPTGRLIYLSTPAGKRGTFFRNWSDPGSDWQKIEIRADQCPRISADFLASERARLGPALFAQEYFCEFIEADDQYFETSAIDAAFDADDLEPMIIRRAAS